MKNRVPYAQKAVRHLKKTDPLLASLIEKIGPCSLEFRPKESVYNSLGRSILYQQLHAKAAETILGRLCSLADTQARFPNPDKIIALSEADLRAVGLSKAKALAVKDLALKTNEGAIPSIRAAQHLSDEELIETLTQVRGIGPWTAQMFLIFTLGRPDVMPSADFAVQKAFGILYGKKKHPSSKELEKHSVIWKPYRTVAAWYFWRFLD